MTSFDHDSRDLAELYDRVSDIQFEGGKRLVERLGVTAGARVLDVGCGTGRLVQWIAERVGATGVVAGIDPLAERIAIARTRSAARFEVGSAEDLGAFDDASFDSVCMSSVLHWVDDKAKALAEARRVLRPGGQLGVTTLPQELARAGTLGRILVPMLSRPPYAGRVEFGALFATRGCTTSELASLVVDSGLDLVELVVVQRGRVHASGAALVDFIDASSFGNFMRAVPDELRVSLRSELIAAFDAQRGPSAGGPSPVGSDASLLRGGRVGDRSGLGPDGVISRGWGVRLVAVR